MKTNMKPLRKFLFTIALLAVSASSLFAQKKKPAAAHLYEPDFHAIVDKIEREHIPLDGDSARFIPFRKDALYGFVDKQTKEWVIQPKFAQVFAVYREGAIVKMENGKKHIDGYGLVGYNGKFIIQPYFSNLFKEGDMYHGLTNAVDKSMEESSSMFVRNMYFDLNGKFLFEAPAHRFNTFEEGDSLAWFRYGPDYSVFNRKGKLVKQFSYDSSKHFLGIFNNVLVTSHKKGEQSIYEGFDIKDRPKFSIPYDDGYATAVTALNDTTFLFLSEDGVALTDAKGNIYPYGISNGWYGFGFRNLFSAFNSMDLITVTDFNTNKMGAISREGKLVIPCEHEYLGVFENGIAPYYDSMTLVGFINNKNEVVIRPGFDRRNIYDAYTASQRFGFSEGLCRTLVLIPDSVVNGVSYIHTENQRTAMRIAYINRNGEQKILLPDSIAIAGDFSGGLAVITAKSGATGFIDTTGKIVIPLKYELAAAGAYPFPQIIYPAFINGYAYIKSYKGYIDSKGKEYFSGRRMKDEYDFSH